MQLHYWMLCEYITGCRCLCTVHWGCSKHVPWSMCYGVLQSMTFSSWHTADWRCTGPDSSAEEQIYCVIVIYDQHLADAFIQSYVADQFNPFQFDQTHRWINQNEHNRKQHQIFELPIVLLRQNLVELTRNETHLINHQLNWNIRKTWNRHRYKLS